MIIDHIIKPQLACNSFFLAHSWINQVLDTSPEVPSVRKVLYNLSCYF